VGAHDVEGFVQRHLGLDRDGVGDHPALALLDAGDFVDLAGDRHVAVDEAHPALLGHGDGRARFGHGVHGRAHERDVELDGSSQSGPDFGVAGHDVGCSWQEQHVIESVGFSEAFRVYHVVL